MSREQLRKEVDDQIQALMERIRQLKSNRNMLSPAMLLPSEFLATVFQYCKPQDESTGISSFRWMRVTLVCRHWRRVALSSTKLWSEVNAIWRYDLLSAMLER